jgi:cytochrome c556
MNRLADALDRALAERDRARDLAAALEAVNAQLRADRDELRYALATAMCSTEGCHGDGCAVCQPPGASS